MKWAVIAILSATVFMGVAWHFYPREDVVTFESQKHLNRYVAALQSDEIPHRIEAGNRVIFPDRYSEEALNHFYALTREPKRRLMGMYIPTRLESEVSDALAQHSIQFHTFAEGDQVLVSWPKEVHGRAKRIVAEILVANGA